MEQILEPTLPIYRTFPLFNFQEAILFTFVHPFQNRKINEFHVIGNTLLQRP